MNENECLQKLVMPDHRRNRQGHLRRGTLQIHITRACTQACYFCTQGSNFGGKTYFMPVEMFEQACISLRNFWGVVGVFGGCPNLHPQFIDICEVFRKHIPFPQRGLWSNDLVNKEKAVAARATFNPAVSNLNVHMDRKAWDLIRSQWPEARPFGLDSDSRHAPVFVAMKDLNQLPKFDQEHRLVGTMENTEENRYSLIADCDINQNWSALMGMFRGKLRAWFCEIAGAQSMLHQEDSDYPDTGLDPTLDYDRHGKPVTNSAGEPLHVHGSLKWWQLGAEAFRGQVRKHCHDCGVPTRGYGELAVSKNGTEQVSETHRSIAKPKRLEREVEVVSQLIQLNIGKLVRTTDYVQNSKR